jgi:hypothetical protein
MDPEDELTIILRNIGNFTSRHGVTYQKVWILDRRFIAISAINEHVEVCVKQFRYSPGETRGGR